MTKRAGRKFGQKAMLSFKKAKVRSNKKRIDDFCTRNCADIQRKLQQCLGKNEVKISQNLRIWMRRLSLRIPGITCNNKDQKDVLCHFYRLYRSEGQKQAFQEFELYCPFRAKCYRSYESFYWHSRKGKRPCLECLQQNQSGNRQLTEQQRLIKTSYIEKQELQMMEQKKQRIFSNIQNSVWNKVEQN